MLEKFNLLEFENLSQQDKDTYILYLLTIPEQERTNVDKHILKFNAIGMKPENILVEN